MPDSRRSTTPGTASSRRSVREAFHAREPEERAEGRAGLLDGV
jgi:hypothetical protein